MDERAKDQESLSGSNQYPVSNFAMGEGSSFSLSSIGIDGSKDSTGLAGDLFS
jgi:hypothetical protein